MFNRPHRRRKHQAGFTLPEILVAFVVLALSLCAILPSFSNGLSGIGASKFYGEALALAQSKIDQLGTEIPLEQTELTGMTESGLTWIARLSRRQADGLRRVIDVDSSGVVSYEIEIAITNDEGRSLTIKTIRLAPLQ
jgi:general secretion pathway protein I